MAYDSFRAALASRVKISRSGLTHPRRYLHFGHENVPLLGRNFFARFFSRQEFSCHREHHQDFASWQDSCLHPRGGGDFFLAGSCQYRFLRGILAEIHCRNFFPQEGSCRENGPPWWDHGTYFTRAVSRIVCFSN